MALTSKERGMLRDDLFQEWLKVDPEGCFLWQQGQDYCDFTGSLNPALISRPEFYYRQALQNGNLVLLRQLAQVNPGATLDLLAADHLLGPELKKIAPGLLETLAKQGLAGDPGFAQRLEEAVEPDLQTEVLPAIATSLAQSGQAGPLAALWRDYPEVLDASYLGKTLDTLKKSGGSYHEALLPGEGWSQGQIDPLSELKFDRRVLEVYLPGSSGEDLRTLLENAPTSGMPWGQEVAPEMLADLAEGRSTPEALQALAKSAAMEFYVPDVMEHAADPDFRDAVLKMMLECSYHPEFRREETEEEQRLRLISEITDESLRAEMAAKFPEGKKAPEEDPGENP